MVSKSKTFGVLGVLMVFAGIVNPPIAKADAKVEEDFKGKSSEKEITLGVTQGMGLMDASVGYGVLFNAGKKLVHRGWVGDLNDQIFIEVEMGPLFIASTTIFAYSAHLRWDFQKDQDWTLFAFGGLGGDITGASMGNRWELFPRFGVGAFYALNSQLSLRGELSHEFVTLGVSYGI